MWIDALPVSGDAEWHALLMRESVTVPGPACERLAHAASSAGVVLVIGVNERDRHSAAIQLGHVEADPGHVLVRERTCVGSPA